MLQVQNSDPREQWCNMSRMVRMPVLSHKPMFPELLQTTNSSANPQTKRKRQFGTALRLTKDAVGRTQADINAAANICQSKP